jgi:HSP20 family protein
MFEIIRREPFDRSVRDLLSFVTRDPFVADPVFANGRGTGTLPLDIAQGDGELIVEASLPGFRKEDVEVQIHDGVLSIKAERTDESETRDEHFHRRERRTGSVSRQIALPGEVSDADAHAELTDGVLSLRIPLAEAAKPKLIAVN